MTFVRALALLALVPLAAAQNPTPYCTAGVSSNSCAALIGANGQPNVTNTAGCVITVSGVSANKQGVIFYGVDNTGFTPSVWAGGLSSSYLCVKAPFQRLGAPQNSGGTSGQCNGVYVTNWDAFQIANPTALGNPWLTGDKAYLQSWYRDPLAVNASNLSNALQLTLRPPPLSCSMSIPGMVAIPAGTFMMGSSAACANPYYECGSGQPVHQVTLSYCFWMSQKEVTQTQYASLMGTNPSNYWGPTSPVTNVTWTNARAYCAALTTQQVALGNVPQGYQYRLPTEAEWEYACRAGTTTEFNVGSALTCSHAEFSYSFHSNFWCNCACSTATPIPVGAFASNAWGLFDMHGNVQEWCLDAMDSYSAGAVIDPFATSGVSVGTPPATARVRRGGGYRDYSSDCRSASRLADHPDNTNVDVGFRVVLAPILIP